MNSVVWKSVLNLVAILNGIGPVRSHSWLACSDYVVKNAATWNAELCRGFPRDSGTYAPKLKFGIDTGAFLTENTGIVLLWHILGGL